MHLDGMRMAAGTGSGQITHVVVFYVATRRMLADGELLPGASIVGRSA
ncbi:hypothetical protein FHW37_101364 [Neorhizobium alkalisoli]|uniref:Uncharacterized protein n=1 Tax=Neorhizobium alkalisoli TaxID=528178 RepID=A0A561R7H5_9HYPH|nr:hypothetical protein FHW37_101364 [Neorhizobium alkalisoli]